MARLFGKYSAIYKNVNLPNSIKKSQIGSKFMPYQNKPSKYSQRLLTFCQSGEISPNIVTLDSCDKAGYVAS